jgi:hypothetical protein
MTKLRKLRPLPIATGLIAAAMIAGCGGGGNDSTDSDAGVQATTAQVESMNTGSPAESLATSATGKASPESVMTTRAGPNATAPGTGVFVDAVNGNDGNAGTFAAPWKTLAKLASAAHLKAGDGVWLACGSTWREALSLGSSQLVSGSIISSYGSTCAKTPATISGADLFSGGWTKSGNVWSKPISTSEPKVLRMFINGVAQRPAQWPNYGGTGKETRWLTPLRPPRARIWSSVAATLPHWLART